jgi:uncharacterized protein
MRPSETPRWGVRSVAREDLEAQVFGLSLLLLAVHAADAGLVHQTGHSAAGVAALGAVIVLGPSLWRVFLGGGRLVRAALAGAFGLGAAVLALSVEVPHIALAGAGGSDYTGVLLGLGGLVLLGLAFRIGLRGRRLAVRLAIGAVALFIIAQWVVAPAITAGLATNAPRPRIPAAATLGLPGARDVSFPARDGVRLSGWYIPTRNGAAVILLHGSHGSRMDTVGHLRMLAAAGYGVLAYDARGHGRSAGQTNALGWRGTDDIAGAVEFLAHQSRVDRRRVAALGLSMGAEEALRAVGSGVPLDAVIADGAGASTLGDSELTQPASGPLFTSVTWLTMRGVELLAGEREPAPLQTIVARIPVPVLLIASGRSGERTIDAAYRQRIGARATLWFVGNASHTAALTKHPHAYATRVVAFLAAALSPATSTTIPTSNSQVKP